MSECVDRGLCFIYWWAGRSITEDGYMGESTYLVVFTIGHWIKLEQNLSCCISAHVLDNSCVVQL